MSNKRHRFESILRLIYPPCNVSSRGQQPIDLDDVMMTHDYDDLRAYRQSKLVQIMFLFDLADQLKGSNVTVNCLHPGSLMNTNMGLNA